MSPVTSSSIRGPLAIHTFTLIVFMAASGAPTPLYRLYQVAWRFTPTLLTVIFAVYAFALLATLLFAGRISDHVGRRSTIAVGIGLDVLAMVAFMFADGPAWLIAARFVQGVATGLAMSALGAALLDVDRHHGATVNSLAPLVGLALGALGSTALVVLAPAPLHTVYVVMAGLLVLCFGLTMLAPETAGGRPGALASLRPNVAVPEQARAALWAVTPLNVAVWMLGGFYLSLMPSLVAIATRSTSPWLGGVTVASLMLTGALAVFGAMRLAPLRALFLGALLLVAGLAMILGGASAGSAGWLMSGSIVGGGGFGAAFLGAMRSVLPLAEPHERSRLMAVFYIESYLAFSMPAIAMGYVAQRLGLRTATDIYGAVIVALTLAGVGWVASRSRHVEHDPVMATQP